MKIANIGIDVGGTTIKGGLVDKDGKIIYKTDKKTSPELGSEYFLDTVKTLISELLSIGKKEGFEIKGIGIGIPGAVNNNLGTIDYACNLNLENVDIKSYLANFKLPIYLSNDANVACLAEQKFGAAKGRPNVIMLTLGTGVGGGVVIDNKLFEGVDGKGTELGHTVIEMDGIECGCGRKGCFEAYASATALIRYTKEAMENDKSSKMWGFCRDNLENVNGLTAFECAKEGDKSANEVVDKYIKYLGEGILNYCNIFRPNCIVLGGGISNQKDYLVNKLVEYCEERDYGYKNTPKVEILIATLTNDAGIIGAAHLLSY